MAKPEKIVLGSRGSDLALAQTRLVEAALRRAWPALEVSVEIIRTIGDEGARAPVERKAGRKGMFTRAIEERLLVRQIDLAVHSAKDLPSEVMEELEIRAVLPRAPAGDVLIAKEKVGLTSLAHGVTIATGSVRRQHQLRWQRPDLKVEDLRGNVPTRLGKLQENENWAGIVLARAGLERLGAKIDRTLRLPTMETAAKNQFGQPERSPYHCEILSLDDFVPAGGQGVIALQIRREDENARRMVDAINDRDTFTVLRAEREFLRLLDGDCDSPVGVHARVKAEEIELRAQIFESALTPPRTGITSGSRNDPAAVAAVLMQQIYDR